MSVCGGRVRHQPSVNTIRLSLMSRSALNPNQEGLEGCVVVASKKPFKIVLFLCHNFTEVPVDPP